MLVCQLCMYDFITSVSDIGYTGIRNIFFIGVGRVGVSCPTENKMAGKSANSYSYKEKALLPH